MLLTDNRHGDRLSSSGLRANTARVYHGSYLLFPQSRLHGLGQKLWLVVAPQMRRCSPCVNSAANTTSTPLARKLRAHCQHQSFTREFGVARDCPTTLQGLALAQIQFTLEMALCFAFPRRAYPFPPATPSTSPCPTTSRPPAAWRCVFSSFTVLFLPSIICRRANR